MANRKTTPIHCDRRPMTRKEIKFFGTALSFDEEMAMVSSNKGNASPKFLRTQSFGMLSPKPGRKFFRSRDKNSNYDYGAMATSAKGSTESLNIRGGAINVINRNASGLMVRKLEFVHESSEIDNIGGGSDTDADCVFGGMQRSEKLHRLIRMRMARMRSRSASTDSWDDPVDKSSSATELISRRGVFSRRHYGSTDQLPQSDLEALDPNCRRFRLENGESLAEIDEVFGSPSTPILENPEHQTRWYFKYFLGKLHQNYVGIDSDKNPYFLSVVSQDSGNKCIPLYRAMLFRKQGAQKIAMPYNSQQKLTVKQLLAHFSAMDANKTPKELFSADIQKDLLLLEEQEGSVNFKFGVVYMKSGQKCDDEMLSNEYGSGAFDEFLAVLGEKIRLKGWERFRGGLDVKGDMTGKHSIYTLYEGHEIMFHVSTLLPFSRDNRQQVERKRHIGNDIVNIVFIDGDADGCDFVPNCIKSQFTHVFAVVTKKNNTYKLSVYCDETVPPFGPTLPNPPEFQDATAFREFLLVKLINGEKATFQTPTFSRKRERTLDMLIKDLYEEYAHDTKTNMLNRRAFSEVLYDAPRASRLKEDARQVEFVRIGQALKLEAIVRGDAPTSLASTGPGTIFKRPPWEPQCFYAAFHHRGNIVGDSFGHDSLFLATDEGTFLIREDQSNQIVFDKTFAVRQMSVVEDHNIMLIRGGSASQKDSSRIYVFRLNEFKEENIKVRSRLDLKERRIEKSRGCHLYATSKGGDGYLRMAVAVGRKMYTFQWKYTAAWTSWCTTNETETVEGFIFLREINLHDSPTIITILDSPSNTTSGLLMCVGYKYHYEIVCEQTGQSSRLHELESSKRVQSQLVAAVDLCDGQETELLLCYNHTCHFQKLQEENKSNEFDFHWNTSPTSIVCAFPYIIAFTSDSMEIRLLVNGNLVHNVTMGDLQLITSKRDIYFATTAPEFIPKDFRIKGLENEQDTDNGAAGAAASRRSSRINDFSNERILEIKHKIEKIEAQNQCDELTNATATASPSTAIPAVVADNEPTLLINAEDSFSKFLPLPRNDQLPCIQRARSLQKPKKELSADEQKRLISKSNSCGDSSTGYTSEFPSLLKQMHLEPSVPPNSPRINSNLSPSSPTKNRLLKSPNNNKHGSIAHTGDHETTERCKPLRIFRIPLANLTGTHSHYHTHNSVPKVSKIQSHKIEEDGFELEDSNDANADDDCDTLDIKNNLKKLSCNCANLSLFSSI